MSDTKTHRTNDFIARYSNNVRFEPYGNDLKLIFGESDLGSGTEVFEQHTAITMSWPQIKVLIYYLRMQLIQWEAQVGQSVVVHPVSIPLSIPDETPDTPALPRAAEVIQAFRDLRAEMFPGA